MKKIIINNDNLGEDEITETVKRVKVLLINSKNEILLGYSDNDYQFIGGHVEDNEELWDTVIRELKEETGIEINSSSKEPIIELDGYYKDWPEKNKNRKSEIYYFEVFTDQIPDLKKVKLTEKEKEYNFTTKYIPLENIEDEIINNNYLYGDKRRIGKEILEIIKIYKNK